MLDKRVRIMEQLTVKAIAKMIYEDRHLKEVLDKKNVSVYVPTYERGD